MKIFLVRHGYDDFVDGETSMGRGQMVMAADVMKSNGINISKTKIITSEHTRTCASAGVMADELGIKKIEEEIWLTDGSGEDVVAGLLEYIEENKEVKNLIAVSHLPEIEHVVDHFKNEYNPDFDQLEVGYGDVYIIDTEKQTIGKLDILP
jgi:phosphohistidine phosphatase SixA